MAELVKLDFLPEREKVLERFDQKVAEIREYLSEKDRCGFAIVAYCRPTPETCGAAGTYYLADAMDSYALPELAKSVIEKIRDS